MAREIVDDPTEGSQMFDAHDGVPAFLYFRINRNPVAYRRINVVKIRMDGASIQLQGIIHGVFEALTGEKEKGPAVVNKIAYVVKDNEDRFTVMWSYDDRVLGIAEYEYSAG